jgi:hypothetical protein
MDHEKNQLYEAVRLALLLGSLSAAGIVWAFPEYASDGQGGDGCNQCHGDFNQGKYVSLKDGQNWNTDLMSVHKNIVSNDCEVCHTTGGRSPVYINSSDGGVGLPPIACIGCHGRAADGTGTGTEGYGAGLRQHHWQADPSHPTLNLRICANCHTDADPSNVTTAGEQVLPPYYGDAGHGNIPFDPCNPPPAFNEDFAGTTIGLDNDGDDIYDMNDTDCSGPLPFPGAIDSLVLGKSTAVQGDIDLTWGASCSGAADDYEVYEGEIGLFDSHVKRICTTAGALTSRITPSGDNQYYLVVPIKSSSEGSYGKKLVAGVLSERLPPAQEADRCLVVQDTTTCP